MTDFESLKFPLWDECYGINYVSSQDYRWVSDNESPFTAPSAIVQELIATGLKEEEKAEERFEEPVLDIPPINKDKKKYNKLLHALGTWHIAEQCLEFGRLKVLKNLREMPGTHKETLASRLIYGEDDASTLLEEFCLAAFLQAHLEKPSSTTGVEELREYLDGSEKYNEYTNKNNNRIVTEIIAYWMWGPDDDNPPILDDFVPENVRKNSERYNDLFKGEYGAERVKRVRKLYFADDAPLNLRHLDLVGRIYYDRFGSKNLSKPIHFLMAGFLSRIYLAPQRSEHYHLLPEEWWYRRSPYYVPREDDGADYRYLHYLITGLKEFKTEVSKKSEASKKCMDHSLSHAFDGKEAAIDSEKFTGFLRLSLPHRRLPGESTEVFHKYMHEWTGPMPKTDSEDHR